MNGRLSGGSDIGVQVSVSGSIAEELAKLGKKLTKEVMVDAAKAGATIVALSINQRVPVDKGLLKDSLGVEIKTNSKGVLATVGFLDSFQARIAFWVEHGHNNRVARTAMQRFFKAKHGDTIGHVPPHPFFTPGVDSALAASSEAVTGVIVKALQSDTSESTGGKGVIA